MTLSQWKSPEFWLVLLATVITVAMAVDLIPVNGLYGKGALVLLATLQAIGIKAAAVSVNSALLSPAPSQGPMVVVNKTVNEASFPQSPAPPAQ